MRGFWSARLWLALGVAVLVGAAAGAGTAAKKPPPVVVESFRWVGFDKDVVGRGTSAKPNGERDGHFRVVLTAPSGSVRVDELELRRCVVNTPPPCPSFAATTPRPNDRPVPLNAILGVLRGGTRLTLTPPGRILRLDGKRIQLELYVNDGPGCIQAPQANGTPYGCRAKVTNDKREDYRLAPGQRFRLDVVTPTGTVSSAWLTVPGQAATRTSPPAAIGNYRYVGLERDVIGQAARSGPDGRLDAHFAFDLTTPYGPVYLLNVNLHVLLGERPVASYHSDQRQGDPGFAVFLDGKRLQLEAVKPNCIGNEQDACSPPVANWVDLRWSSKPVRFDLYATDLPSEPFVPGRRWRIAVIPMLMPKGTPGLQARGVDTPWLTLP